MVGFHTSVPDCMKPDPVASEKKALKQLRKKKKKSAASTDADWVPELEEVSFRVYRTVNCHLLIINTELSAVDSLCFMHNVKF